MNTKKLTGTCYCGNIKYQINGEFGSQCFCHCRSCRLASGTPYVAWRTVPRTAFVILQGTLKEISGAPGVTRGSCPDCGTSLTYHNDKTRDEIDICLATITEPGRVKPAFHIWVADKLPWITIDDGLPQYPEWRNG